jgi:hypothetical protein
LEKVKEEGSVLNCVYLRALSEETYCQITINMKTLFFDDLDLSTYEQILVWLWMNWNV